MPKSQRQGCYLGGKADTLYPEPSKLGTPSPRCSYRGDEGSVGHAGTCTSSGSKPTGHRPDFVHGFVHETQRDTPRREDAKDQQHRCVPPVDRGQRRHQRPGETPETYVVWLIPQRSRVQIPPPLPSWQVRGLFQSRKRPLACPCANGRRFSANFTLLCFGDAGRTPEECKPLLRV